MDVKTKRLYSVIALIIVIIAALTWLVFTRITQLQQQSVKTTNEIEAVKKAPESDDQELPRITTNNLNTSDVTQNTNSSPSTNISTTDTTNETTINIDQEIDQRTTQNQPFLTQLTQRVADLCLKRSD